jgi:4-alpha-glucanotransferase
VYTGTHDNPTTRGWYAELSDMQRQQQLSYLGRAGGAAPEVVPALTQLAWESEAALAIAPLQDLLNLGNEARMNVPGRTEGNWRWRCTDEMLTTCAFEWLRDLTKRSGRSQGGSSR